MNKSICNYSALNGLYAYVWLYHRLNITRIKNIKWSACTCSVNKKRPKITFLPGKNVRHLRDAMKMTL